MADRGIGDITIHATQAYSRVGEKRSGRISINGSQASLPKRPRSEKAKASKHSSNSSIQPKSEPMEVGGSTSFRHLFGFAGQDVKGPSNVAASLESSAPKPFSFLGQQVQQDPRNAASADTRTEPSNHDMLPAWNGPKLSETDAAVSHQWAHNPSTEPAQLDNYANSVHEEGQLSYLDHRESIQVREQTRCRILPEDIADRPEEILAIARNFRRQKTIDELNQEWEGPYGAREDMKRTFRMKRQAFNRGKKFAT